MDILQYFSKILLKNILINSILGADKNKHYALTIFYMLLVNIHNLMSFKIIDIRIENDDGLKYINYSSHEVPQGFKLTHSSIIVQLLSVFIFISFPVIVQDIHRLKFTLIQIIKRSIYIFGYSIIMFLCWNFAYYYLFAMWDNVYYTQRTRIEYLAGLEKNCISMFSTKHYDIIAILLPVILGGIFILILMNVDGCPCCPVFGKNAFDRHFSIISCLFALIYLMLALEHVIQIERCKVYL